MNESSNPLDEQALHERLDVNFVLKAARLGLWEVDPQTYQLHLNEPCRQLFGLSKPQTLSYQQALDHIHPDDVESLRQAVRQALSPQSDGYYEQTFRILGIDDGQERWVRFMGQAYFTESGQLSRFAGLAQDVTLYQRQQEQLETSRRLNQLATEAAGIGSFHVRLADGYMESNPLLMPLLTGQHTIQYSREALANFIHPDDRPIRQQAYEEGLQTGRVAYTVRFCWLDGSQHWVSLLGRYTFDEAGQATTLTGVMQDVTEQVRASQQLAESEAFSRNVLHNSPVAKVVFVGPTLIIRTINEHMLALLGRDASIIGQPFLAAVPELMDTPLMKRLEHVLTSGETYHQPQEQLDLIRYGRPYRGYYSYTYKALYNGAGQRYGVMVTATEVTDLVKARQQVEESEARFRSLIEQAPIATCVFVGRELRIEVANSMMITYFGQGPTILGKPIRDVLRQEKDQPAIHLLEHVWTTAQAYEAKAAPAELVLNGRPGTYYFDISLKPLLNAAGEVYAIMEMALEVTDQVLAHQQVEASEAALRSLVTSAPFPIGVYVGPQMRIQLANHSLIEVWGKGPDVVGKTYAEVLPELGQQGVYDQLDRVYQTAQAYHANNQRVDLLIDGQLQTRYFKYSFTPLFDAQGHVYGVMNTAAEVTDLVLAKQQIEQAETALRGAIDLAELGTWELDVATGAVTYSERIKSWFGFKDDAVQVNTVYNPIHEGDRHRIETAIGQALQPGSAGVYDEEYRLIEQHTGKERIIHAQGKTFFDAQGQPLKLRGTAQDVTPQRRLQQELERQVAQRTQQLEATIGDLQRSNQNLEQFAYVASHDLQEPLRKIQSFGAILQDQYADRLGPGVNYLERMQSAASRMSTLIRDLLSYSRISTQQEATASVALDKVLETVLTDLEVRIQETGAVIEVESLPTVQGNPSQLGQLLQNLLGNALKFRRAGVAPLIQVRVQRVNAGDLPAWVHPTRQAQTYHCIEVADNGIGFDERYVDRIFQVFQRLHGKQQFTGTGIGLAICQKVAANHGGAITARSQVGQGATFSVYLPVVELNE